MAQGDVIRRKLAEGRAAGRAGPQLAVQGTDRAWPLALARAARDSFALGLGVSTLETRHPSLTELLDLVPDRALIAVLEGPEDGLGIMALSQEVLAGLIEVQTLGRVTTGAVQARKPTRTDAAMVAGWIDQALEALEGALAADADLPWADGFRYASFLDDPRPLGLLLDDAPFRLLTARVDLAMGAKSGALLLALPASGRGRKPSGQDAGVEHVAPAPVFEELIRDRILDAQCEMQAVIAQVSLPLSAVINLSVGMTLPLPDAAIDRIQVETIGGRRLASGRLGQHRGLRAVRLVAMEGGHRSGQAAAVSPVMPEAEPEVRLVATG
jgi:flagellar motor switch protein FliM